MSCIRWTWRRRLDAGRLGKVMIELFDRSSAVVKRCGGTVDKFTGAGIMAILGAPVAGTITLFARPSLPCTPRRKSTISPARCRTEMVSAAVAVRADSGDGITREAGHVAVKEVGEPYILGSLTNMWYRMTEAAGVGSDPTARRPPLVRHGDTRSRRTDGRHRQVAQPRRRLRHGAHLRALAGQRTAPCYCTA
jgi:class 3 adenylate cyclase